MLQVYLMSAKTRKMHRSGVAAIIRDRAGKILVCERTDFRGGWQFPQGGIDEGETKEEALARELMEELGLDSSHWKIVGVRGPYRYRFTAGRMKHGFHGQAHHYFLLDFLGPKSRIRVDRPKPEFRAVRWIRPGDFKLEWLPLMKQRPYRAVFRQFFGVNLSSRAK